MSGEWDQKREEGCRVAWRGRRCRGNGFGLATRRARVDQGSFKHFWEVTLTLNRQIGAHRGEKTSNLDARAVKGVWPWPCQHVLPLRQCWFLSFSSQVQIQSKKVDISKVSSKCGSKANIKHKPGERPSLPWCPASGLSPSVCHCTVVLARLPRDSAEDSAVLPLREREERESRLRLQGPHLGARCAGAADQDVGRAFPGSGVGPGHGQFRRKLSQRCSGGHTGWRGEPHPVAWTA